MLVTLHVLEDLGVLEAQRDPLLPNDPQKRKAVPLYSGLAKYFPDALAAVAELSRIGNEQHNPGEPLHWDRAKSTDELDAAMRHLFEAGTIDSDGTRHSTKLAWRALANLQKELEEAQALLAVAAAQAAQPAELAMQNQSASLSYGYCQLHGTYFSECAACQKNKSGGKPQ